VSAASMITSAMPRFSVLVALCAFSRLDWDMEGGGRTRWRLSLAVGNGLPAAQDQESLARGLRRRWARLGGKC
jgi:hypothetical protein